MSGGSDAAITMTGAPRSVIQSNNVYGVGDAAILLAASTANVVRFNTLGQSADAGVVLSGVSDSLIKGNTMSHAGDAAISLQLGSSNVRIIDNQASHSSDAGVFMAEGVGNVVRGNVLLSNTTGIEVSGGRGNLVEFNTTNAGLGTGIEVADSVTATVFGNTTNNNGTGGIVADDGALSADVRGNQASGTGGDGIAVGGVGTAVNNNLATNNGGWGIYAASGVLDNGANGARGNAEPAQCYLISCSNGHGWIAPGRPPEPLDPLEIGLEGGVAPPPRKVRGLRRPKKRLAVVSCRERRAPKRGRGKAKAAKPKTVCEASYRARRGSLRLTGRLVRDDVPDGVVVLDLLRPSLRLAEPLAADVVRDRNQPVLRVPRPFPAREGAVRVHEGRLRDVLRVGGIAQDRERVAIDVADVSAVDTFERPVQPGLLRQQRRHTNHDPAGHGNLRYGRIGSSGGAGSVGVGGSDGSGGGSTGSGGSCAGGGEGSGGTGGSCGTGTEGAGGTSTCTRRTRGCGRRSRRGTRSSAIFISGSRAGDARPSPRSSNTRPVTAPAASRRAKRSTASACAAR